MCFKDTIKKMKSQPTGRKFWQIIYAIKDLYLEFINNTYKLINEKQPNLKMGKGFEWTILQKGMHANR